MNLSYNCAFNNLPEWIKIIIVTEALMFNFVIFFFIACNIYFKYFYKDKF